MVNKDKENRVLYITHSGELLIWLIVILFIVACITFTIMNKHSSHKNYYRIFLPDVDGLIVGSPVRMMGIKVGHVTRIRPAHDEVYVKFVIKDKNITLPKGTQATVEFSGMAGSKSLELYLPDEKTYVDDSVPLLTVNPPKRLHDAFGLLNDMFKKIGFMITTTSIFGKNLKTIELPQGASTQGMNEFLIYTNTILDDSNERMKNLEKRLSKYDKKR